MIDKFDPRNWTSREVATATAWGTLLASALATIAYFHAPSVVVTHPFWSQVIFGFMFFGPPISLSAFILRYYATKPRPKRKPVVSRDEERWS